MASSARAIQYTIPAREDFNKLPDEQKTRINEAFDLFDSNKDGVVSYEEFRFILRALGFELPKPQTYDLLIRHGQKPANWPSDQECAPVYRQFSLPTAQALAGSLVSRRDPREELRRAFRLFDTDGKGMITQDDLRRVSKQVGNNIPDADIAAMIEEFDASGKGGVDEDEFLRLMMSKK
ncbi:Calcium-binding component of the spindle pole body (SPB) half-bridge [Collariella sp. IMI 366227]|nr:Calcium-binding component of the spindle pole body (SPB) half-bridge [Collariella sp. IMI 366227]